MKPTYFILFIICLLATSCAPEVEVHAIPEEGGSIWVQDVAPSHPTRPKQALLYLMLKIVNKESDSIQIDSVRYSTSQGMVSFIPELTSNKKYPNPIPPGERTFVGNHRDYGEIKKVLLVDYPLPSEVTALVYCKGFSKPVEVEFPLEGGQGMAAQFPVRTESLDLYEYYNAWSRHGSGGNQTFGIDMDVIGWNGSSWSGKLPGKSGDSAQHFRTWGKPVYAMADGTVSSFENDHFDDILLNDTINNYNKTSGNHFNIKHDGYMASYSHFQKGSLNSDLLVDGTSVNKGQFLGLIGNSGNTSGPHLHVHIMKDPNDERQFRPIRFYDAKVTARENMPDPGVIPDWVTLDSIHIPVDKIVLIRSTATRKWKDYTRAKIPMNYFQNEFIKIADAKYMTKYLNGVTQSGKMYYSISCEPTKHGWLAKHNYPHAKFRTYVDSLKNLGFGAHYMDSYLRNGEVRYNFVWRKLTMDTREYHGYSSGLHTRTFNTFIQDGYVPNQISVVTINGIDNYAAIYEKKNVGGVVHHSNLDFDQFQQKFGRQLSHHHLENLGVGRNRHCLEYYPRSPCRLSPSLRAVS